ncbi:hypothetical protein NA645_19265 [Pseudomonas stutzeri]|uniref:hypothetical protein n=1 Tax=Stutzerimonas stutzeri TaxID=316 RepID=UPI00210DDE4D|nr:hypothetical protein [Stutzerimonas stutzeri]MCQ4310133.1 hypothetical protein [Stutzerimonas stutzeri]
MSKSAFADDHDRQLSAKSSLKPWLARTLAHQDLHETILNSLMQAQLKIAACLHVPPRFQLRNALQKLIKAEADLAKSEANLAAVTADLAEARDRLRKNLRDSWNSGESLTELRTILTRTTRILNNWD